MSHLGPLLPPLNTLNIYQINFFQHLRFMRNFNKNKIPAVFNNLIKKPIHKYSTMFSKKNFSLKSFSLNSSKFYISFRRPKVRNDFLTNGQK